MKMKWQVATYPKWKQAMGVFYLDVPYQTMIQPTFFSCGPFTTVEHFKSDPYYCMIPSTHQATDHDAIENDAMAITATVANVEGWEVTGMSSKSTESLVAVCCWRIPASFTVCFNLQSCQIKSNTRVWSAPLTYRLTPLDIPGLSAKQAFKRRSVYSRRSCRRPKIYCPIKIWRSTSANFLARRAYPRRNSHNVLDTRKSLFLRPIGS